jgi:putative transcriptional regulator
MKKRLPFAESIKQGVREGIRHNRGELQLRVTQVDIPEPPPQYGADDVLRIRRELHMSQASFAALLNVSIKTIQSWEQSERKPSQAAARLLQTIEQPEMLVDFVRQRRAGQAS